MSVTIEFDGQVYSQASSHQKEWGARLIEEFGRNSPFGTPSCSG